MKKILTVSLFAMMAVSAANADIASTAYVEGQTGTLTNLTTTAKGNLVAAINEVDANIGTVSFAAEGYAKDASDLTEAINVIDAALKSTSNDLTVGITSRIGELETDVSAMDTAYKAADTALGNRLTTAEGDITALETSLSATGTTGKAIADNKKAIADMDTAYKAADTAIKNTIGTVTQGKTVVEMISEAQTNATYDDTAVRGLIGDNADAIDAIKKSAYATSGVTSAVVNQVETNKNAISAMDTAYKAADTALGNRLTTAEGDITALETSLSATGTTGKAIADNKKAIADMDTAYKAADTAIKNTIGTVDEGKTVVEMISEAQTNATYDDTEVRGLITTNKNNISAMDTAYKAADTALGNRLTTAEGKITTIEGQQTTQDGKISALETSLSATGTTGKAIADNKKAIADMDTAYKAADTTTLNSAKAFTTEQIEALGKLATIDTACAQGVTDCALVIRSGEIKWEKVSY